MLACTTRGTRPRRCSSRKEFRLASSWTILGHFTIAVTQNIYGHVMPEAVSAATAAVADLLWSEPMATTVAPQRPPKRTSQQ